MIRAPQTRYRNRTRLAKNQAAPPGWATATAGYAGSTITITYSEAVTLRGIPPYTIDGVLPIAATQTANNVITLTAATAASPGDIVVIPNDPTSVRTVRGGYITPTTITLAGDATVVDVVQSLIDDGIFTLTFSVEMDPDTVIASGIQLWVADTAAVIAGITPVSALVFTLNTPSITDEEIFWELLEPSLIFTDDHASPLQPPYFGTVITA